MSTRIPAKWLTALAAVGTLAAGSAPPLATAATNTITSGPGQFVTYSSPAVTSLQASLNYSALVTEGNTAYLLGGQDSAGNAVASVLSIGYTGSNTLAPAIPQPSLPQALVLPAAAATPTTLVSAGGATVSGATITPQTAVYSASLNPNTGVVGAWSPQAALPAPLYQSAYASSGEHVYVVGGLTTGSASVATCYWATVTNGQVTAWNTGPQLPVAPTAAAAAVVNGYLVVASSAVGPSNVVYYAQLNADGSPGAWITGPHIPDFNSILMAPVPGVGLVFFDYIQGTPIVPVTETLTFGPAGPAATIQVQKNNIPVADGPPLLIAAFPSGTGTWAVFGLYNNQYWTQTLTLTPSVSVPLPATGLTSGGTYHVTMSQQGGDLNDYLTVPVQADVYTSTGPTALYRARSGGSWAATTTGNGIPVQVFNQTAGGPPLHFWADNGARHEMMINATTPEATPLGYLEATAQPGPVLNVNPTFTMGTAPWTATGGTVTQSSAQTHGNLPFSGLLTPSGSASTSDIESEKIPVFQGHSYVASAWLYSPTGYADVAVNINWYSSTGTLLSTTAGTVTSVAAATWTEITTTGPVPASAASGTIVIAETGTPPATALLYCYAAMQDESGPMLASVAQIGYTGTGANLVPTDVTPL